MIFSMIYTTVYIHANVYFPTVFLLSKLAQYTEKSGIPLNWGKMVVMGGKKLKGNKV